MASTSGIWLIRVDTGGTFTDCVAHAPSGEVFREKVLSDGTLRGVVEEVVDDATIRVRASWLADAEIDRPSRRLLPPTFFEGAELTISDLVPGRASYRIHSLDHTARTLTLIPDSGDVVRSDSVTALPAGAPFVITTREEAPVVAARLITGTPPDELLPPMEFRLATTRGTNALLEERGAPSVLLTTQGFADALRIGNQQRDDLFAIDIRRPEPLFQEVIEVPERMDSSGSVLKAIARTECACMLHALRERMPGASIAIALLNSHASRDHEVVLEDLARSAGFSDVCISSAVAPFIGFLSRSETAVIEAYLAPVIRDYLAGIAGRMDQRSPFFVMTSAGGLQRVESYRAKDSLLSGPAGGVAGAARAAEKAGTRRIIAFDMGGTSTDVSRYDGDFEYAFEHHVGRARLVAPALAIETVAAGGGSVCWFDGARLRVGPQSAGASPGPACYGAGGPLTITDVNLLLERIDIDRFNIPIRREAAEQAMAQLQDDIAGAGRDHIEREALLRGLLDIANERMADAIRRISIRAGFDPADYTLVAFGGAGPQHACAVADRLGMKRIIVPADAGLLSAWGLGHARIERLAEMLVLKTLDLIHPAQLSASVRSLANEAFARLHEEGVEYERMELRRFIAAARYQGQDSTIEIELEPQAEMPSDAHLVRMIEASFRNEYEKIFGHTPSNRPIELVSLRLMASEKEQVQPATRSDGEGSREDELAESASKPSGRSFFNRGDLVRRGGVNGPAVIVDPDSTTVIEPNWTAQLDSSGAITLVNTSSIEDSVSPMDATTHEAIQLELFTNRFRAIADEMGEMLRRTAISTNVKERLDFSCAILDASGELVVNAPHIPVHLGAMSECVRRVRERIDMKPGDSIITNHPAFGGSHLPDVTLITPVFFHHSTDTPSLIGYVANRAHHAEIGGSRPGSMPPNATTLAEEGVVIPPMHLVRSGQAQWKHIHALLTSDAVHPTRAIRDNIEDLSAALAANRSGEDALRALAGQHGLERVQHYMQELTTQAESAMAGALRRLDGRSFEATETLDDGTPIVVSVGVSAGRAVVDFAGTGATHAGNLNATPAIVRSAVMYVMRLLINDPVPLNEGMMRRITIHIPDDTILNPRFDEHDASQSPAVVGGNVETSQRVVDTLVKALGIMACGQGTMNNVLFGNESFGYYETIGGGSGAGPGFDGAAGLHVHMTNTRLTDPEVLEHRYPVRVIRHEIRRGSGGAGEFKGGDGITRELEFTEPVKLSVLTQHRTIKPFGMAGGANGEQGRQFITRRQPNDETGTIELKSIDACDIQPGDRLTIETPSGGAYGAPTS